MHTTTLVDLVRRMSLEDLGEMMAIADDVLGGWPVLPDPIDEAVDLSLRVELRRLVSKEWDRRNRLRQLEFDLRAAGDQAKLVASCMSPPRWLINDYADWLRAGGGRAVNAMCGDWCPCRGAGPEWERIS